MAAPNEQHAISVSPNSSEEIESYQGTPATKLSPFTPEGLLREGLKPIGLGISRSNKPSNVVLFPSNADAVSSTSLRLQDPFTSNHTLTGTTQVITVASKLSPNATEFTPSTLVDSGFDIATSGNTKGTFTSPASHDGFRFLSPYSPAVQSMPSLSPSGQGSASHLTGRNVNGPFFKLGRFSSETGMSRCVVVSETIGNLTAREMDELFNLNEFPSRVHLLTGHLAHANRVYLKFADRYDAEKVLHTIDKKGLHWKTQFISPAEFAMKTEQEGLGYSHVSDHEGQVVVTAKFFQTPGHAEIDATGKFISNLVGNYGDVMVFEVRPGSALEISYRMELYDLRAAEKVLANMNDLKFAASTLTVAPYKPDLEVNTQRSLHSTGPSMIGQHSGFEKAFGSMSLCNHRTNGPQTPQTPDHSPFPFATPSSSQVPIRKYPSGLYTPSSLSSYQNPPWSPAYSPFPELPQQLPTWSAFSPGTIGQERGTPLLSRFRQGHYVQQRRGQGSFAVRRYPDNSSGHHNVVDIERIRQGTDVRTTIMLRNIPNKIDQGMLKEIVDETSFGKYDFMYLRIDFANNCNVGYAFINFEDPYHIIDFVTARAGQRWNRYNSDKVAEVSYATIQGRDCLIQKFRNSSVMLEHVSFRPKVFHTVGPMVGKEDNFPGPDNASKMRRSVENAAHVGLFAPRAGQSFRDEQRRRRSQYDRGTRLAEIEDSFEGDHHDYRKQPNAFHGGSPYGGFPTTY